MSARNPEPGDRVEAVSWHVSHSGTPDENGLIRDPKTNEVLTVDDNITVPPGTLGTVDSVDDAGQVHVKWDNGRTIALIPGTDQWLPA